MTELGEATLLIIPRHASVRSRATEFEVERELFRFVAMQIDRRARPARLRVVVEGPSAAVPNLVKEIAIIARRNGLNGEFRVEIETHIITSSDDSRVDLINAVDSNRIAPEGGMKPGLQLNPLQQ